MATQALFLTLPARWTQIIVCVNHDKSKEYLNDENLINQGIAVLWTVPLMPGAREKGTMKNH